MARWFRVYDDAVDDPKVQRLPPKLFKRKFLASLRGEDNEFSAYIKPARPLPTSKEWIDLRTAIFARDDYTCAYCGERGGRLECDHVFPASRGGASAPDNLVTACFSCNRSKRNKTPEEWGRG